MNIILFGIGKGSEILEKKVRRNHKIVGYSDSVSLIKSYKGIPFYRIDELNKAECDFIVITTINRKNAKKISDMLVEKCPDKSNQIISYHMYSISENYKIKINYSKQTNETYEGIILGNSHARDGILPNYLNHKFINLSFSGQDLYYNFQILKVCLKDENTLFKNLKYIVWDLWDYNILNYDLSLTDSIINYWDGGVLDEHNYFKKSNGSSQTFNDVLYEQCGIVVDEEKRHLLLDLFDDIYSELHEYDFLTDNYWSHIPKNPNIPTPYIMGGVTSKRHDNTVEENKMIFMDIMRIINDLNSNISVIFTLLPRYYQMEYLMSPFVKEWKDELYQFMDEIIKTYSKETKTLFCDYKGENELSCNCYYYRDIHHFNTLGGINQTYKINSILDSLNE